MTKVVLRYRDGKMIEDTADTVEYSGTLLVLHRIRKKVGSLDVIDRKGIYRIYPFAEVVFVEFFE